MQYVIGACIFMSGIIVGVSIHKTVLDDILKAINDKDDK